MDVDEGRNDVDGVDFLEDHTHNINQELLQEGVVDIVHTTGVFRHNI